MDVLVYCFPSGCSSGHSFKGRGGTRQFSSFVFYCTVQTIKILLSRIEILNILKLYETEVANALQCIPAILHC